MGMQRSISFAAMVVAAGPALASGQAAKGAGAAPPLIRSARSGDWSSPRTWERGAVPGAGARVEIRAGDRVVYDVESAVPIRSIHVAGALSFATDCDTRLDVGLIKIEAGSDASENGFDCDRHDGPIAGGDARPTLEVGTPARPVDAAHRATIRLLFFDGMDPRSCPALVCCGGCMELHGAPMSRTWQKLGATAEAGATTVELAEPVSGWRVGDFVVVTATERDRGPGVGGATQPEFPPLNEERTIAAIDGATITLDRPLLHHHLGSGPCRGEVADLSRNVVVESADPDGIRGHTMYHRDSAGSIGYAEFRHLGKVGQLGRYAVHFHRVRDTMRGSSVVGASIWDSANRWITVHGTDYLVVRDCVGYRSIGHGFYVEDGTETENVFDRNLAVEAFAGSQLPGQALPFDHNDGAGFWWANCMNSFTRNVACDCGAYGFRFEARPEKGFDLSLPVRRADGTVANADVRTLPFVRFEENEAHGAAYGVNLGQESLDSQRDEDRHSGVGPDAYHPFVMRNTKIWNTRWAVRLEAPSLIVDGLDVHASVYGFYRAKFVRHAYDRVTIAGTGIAEAFSQGGVPAGLVGPASGNAGFARLGACLTKAEVERFRPLLDLPFVELSPADAERLVRGSYPTRGLVGGCRLPRIVEDPRLAIESGGTCGPFSTPDFPSPLQPIDDLPPATVITSISTLRSGRLLVRGTTSDNGSVVRVNVNGRAATPIEPNFAQWEIVIDRVGGGSFKVRAAAVDASGNVEQTPHEVLFAVAPI